jgi:CheY-like chemotaxis protein
VNESSVPSPPGAPPLAILLSRDLIFTSKVTGTARMLGHRVLVAGDIASATALITESQPRVVFVDLAAGDLVQPPALLALRKLAAPATPFVAFGAHVDTAALDTARAIGCDPVLPRSRFSAELPALISRFLG